MLELTIAESALLLILAVAILIWCGVRCTEIKIDTLLGATVFGFVLMAAGLAHLRSIVMFL